MKPDTKRDPGEAHPERLQKVMAAAGLGSRRALEKLIGLGEVLVDGEPAETGRSVGPGNVIAFRGRRWMVVNKPVRHRTLIYNKPEGEVTTRSDPEGSCRTPRRPGGA